MATVNKNFRIKHGLIVEGSTATVNSQNILTETGGDSYILNLVGGATLVKSVDAGVFSVDGAGNLTVNDNTFDSYGSASAAQGAAEDYADGLAVNYDPAGSASSAQTAAQGYADGLASNYDPVGSASAAQTAAQNYADDLINDASSSSSEVWSAYKTSTEIGVAQTAAEDYADGLAGNYDAAGSATAAEGNAKDYTDLLLGDATIDGSGGNTVTDRIAAAVADLVDAAPAALDTLNELAAALGDAVDAQGLATAIGNKLPLAGGTLTGALAMGTNKITGLGAPTSDNDAATKKYVDDNTYLADMSARGYADGAADDAEAAAITAAAADATTKVAAEAALRISGDAASVSTAAADATTKANAAQAAAEATAAAANTAQQNGTTAFTALNVNDQAKQIAASSTSLGSVVVTAYEWPKADYRSGKFVVKIDNGTHNEISEILLTLDSSDNVAITEYAIVGTNGSRGTITAEVSGSNVRIRVNPVNDSTIKVSGTLIK